jgi:hypothetical protein
MSRKSVAVATGKSSTLALLPDRPTERSTSSLTVSRAARMPSKASTVASSAASASLRNTSWTPSTT